ncbi:zinc finger MYM-type protein 1 isoform X1 [Solenopsis invicta]|uniref:zinc finger MYM-type protein 1 isoform X1 n=1 Tax=Solenopsis invicta TaxID=13686 RepID=UPI00193D7CD6|nr:zinc finger MYM-type protein 1 isoform X1 [Solenopsis invicta]
MLLGLHSKQLKGALCLYCVLFPSTVTHGVLGLFIIRLFTRYKHIHEYCKNHVSSHWHKVAVIAAKNFTEDLPVQVLMVSAHKKVIEENRKILTSIISTIIFCGTHDLPLRGKNQCEGVFQDLIQLKIEADDENLKQHMEKGKKNAIYISPGIQNELIDICGTVIKNDIINDAKKAYVYSILADESCDISGKEQLSIGVRFFDEKIMAVREKIIGFVELPAMDAKTIATAIDNFSQNESFDVDKCVGQGYDGCSTMPGKDGGVQKILREKYKKALFFYCASHKLNLVVNDLNFVPEIRNTISTVKNIINFFRESVIRRKYAPNIPIFCETRWSQKYKSIAIFKENFLSIVQGFELLSKDGNTATRKTAFQLHCAATKSQFIICIGLIAKYSALLEPVVNALQSKSINILQCANHIKKILIVIKGHREIADVISQDLLAAANITAQNIGVEIQQQRIIGQQQYRSNPPASNPTEFWKSGYQK